MTPEELTLWAHIAAGFVALFAGLGAFLTEKGGRRHRRLGRAYVYAMAFVSGSALVLFAFDPTFLRRFLALVAVFSFYFAFSGYRVLGRKRPTDGAAAVDWLAVGLVGAASVPLLAMGGVLALGGDSFAPMALVFGGIGAVFAGTDALKFRRERDRGAWVPEHVTRMGAAYIATVTAFATVNFGFLPTVVRWLGPTVVGTPVLIYLSATYKERFAPA
ncbi:DUF2306 domain-containing protein [Halosimplex halophilum]|uniref:DUF2306 domain-containing protein n=1 Tax=Halosimplex halophilum TaxID=2559572 RepID=UPI00107EF60D|nr:DUF2306 domain-containing protein [Halosimplex halophilum]